MSHDPVIEPYPGRGLRGRLPSSTWGARFAVGPQGDMRLRASA